MADKPPEFREEYDEKADIMRAWMSDKPIARQNILHANGLKHVFHVDSDGEIVMVEIHEFSKSKEREEQVQKHEFFADPNSTETLGSASYDIIECSNNSVIASGTMNPLLSTARVAIFERPDDPLAEKSFLLAPPFRIGLGGSLDNTIICGFAFTGTSDEARLFSWDWFQVDTPGFAWKIQEGGELAFEIANRGGKFQIVKTELLSDISIRLSDLNAPRDQLAYRINLKNGSVIHWPCLVDGKVVL